MFQPLQHFTAELWDMGKKIVISPNIVNDHLFIAIWSESWATSMQVGRLQSVRSTSFRTTEDGYDFRKQKTAETNQSPRQSTYYDTKIKRNPFVVSYRF